MQVDGLVLDIEGGIATLRIDRPQARGALTAAMWAAVPEILRGLEKDPEVSVLVLTGSQGVFSAGADIRELQGHYATAESADAYHALNAAAEQALAGFPKPTIAYVEGPCVGGGCQLAVACDLRFAAEGARFGITPAKLGIVYDPVSTRRVADLVGRSAAKFLLFSGELIDSQHALRIGLVDALKSREEAYEFARTVASRSQLTVRSVKDVIDGAPDERIRAWERISRGSDEVREGLAAFTERRPAEFTWNGHRP